MSTSEQTPAANPNDPTCVLLRRIEQQKLETLASAVICDPSAISRFTNDKGGLTLAHLRRLLDATGLRLVDAEARCVMAAELQMLRSLYARAVYEAPHLLEFKP